MDIEEVKKILGIPASDTRHDEYLETVVPMFIEHTKEYCNRPFTDDSGNEDLPGGVKIAVAKWAEHNMQKSGLRSRTMGQVSYAYDTDMPKDIRKMLVPYRRLSW